MQLSAVFCRHRPFARPALLAVALALFLAHAPRIARGEIFVLTHGGALKGELLNPHENPRESFVVRTPFGGRITLTREQVERVVVKSPEEQRYEEILPKMPLTVEGLWKMCEWCRETGLQEQRQTHLRELLKLDPDHQGARLALGFSRIDDKWIRTDDYMRSRGFIRHQGAWRLPQEVALAEHESQIEEKDKEWRRSLKIWRGLLGRRRGAEAINNIRNIRDPLAAPAVAAMLPEESSRELREIYVKVLGRLGTPSAVSALAQQALEDPDLRVRDDCLDQLARLKSRTAALTFVHALKSKDNVKINRAAAGLARLGYRAAIAPLIDVVTTRQKFKLVSGSPGGLGTTFGKDGLSGISAGSSQRIVERNVQNEAVRQALVLLTDGANYGFDKNAWTRWYAAKHAPDRFDLRRDE